MSKKYMATKGILERIKRLEIIAGQAGSKEADDALRELLAETGPGPIRACPKCQQAMQWNPVSEEWECYICGYWMAG